MRITPKMIHEAYCAASPEVAHQDFEEIDQTALLRYSAMAEYLNKQSANEVAHLQATIEMLRAHIETHEQEESVGEQPPREERDEY